MSAFIARSPVLLLLITGTLLAVTILLSRVATDAGAPMLWFLSIVMGAAGIVLFAAAALTGQVHGRARTVILYGLGAGGFQALSMAMAVLSVAHVGAGYVALVFAFPLLLTYVLALGLGMERFVLTRGIGVALALAGGVILAAGKFTGLAGTGAVGWVLIASAIPVIIAGGNIFRTRYWPKGAAPLLLAGVMLMSAAALVVPFAIGLHGMAALGGMAQSGAVLGVLAAGAAAFALQFVTYFQLQKVAGPVYLSQIGSVGAAVGAPAAVVIFGETLPQGFALAAALVVLGAGLFQRSVTSATRGTRAKA